MSLHGGRHTVVQIHILLRPETSSPFLCSLHTWALAQSFPFVSMVSGQQQSHFTEEEVKPS